MSKEQIEKTLIILDEDEAREVMRLTGQDDDEAIYRFVRDVIAKKIEAALRLRCG